MSPLKERQVAVLVQKGPRVATRGLSCYSVAVEGEREALLTRLSILLKRKASVLSDSVGRWDLNSVKQPALRSHSVNHLRRSVGKPSKPWLASLIS